MVLNGRGSESLFKFQSELVSWNKQKEALGRSYRRPQADGADSGSSACAGSGPAACPGPVEEVEEGRCPLPSSLGRGVERQPWRRGTQSDLQTWV